MWKNIKLTTVRRDRPKYRGFKVLDHVKGIFKEGESDLIIWGVQEPMPLKDEDPVLMALDGFLNINQAVEDLKQYRGHEDTDENSLVILFGTIDSYHVPGEIINLERFGKLTRQWKGESLSKLKGRSFQQVF